MPSYCVSAATAEEVEEVFAEDYDDPNLPSSVPPIQEVVPPAGADSGEEDTDEPDQLIYDTLACPNRANPFHECVDFCKIKWGYRKFEPDPKSDKKIERMLRKYPLPPGWIAVGDPST